VPAFIPGNNIEIIGPAQYDASFEDLLSKQMQYSYFPVNYSQLGASLHHRDIMEGTIEVNGFKITAKAVNHPVRTLAYRFEREGKSIVLVSDSEPYYDLVFNGEPPEDEEEMIEFEEVQKTVEEENQKVIDFCSGADILIHDAQYTMAEYPPKRGWGHTPMEKVIEIAKKAKARDLIFFHHDPTRTDEELKRLIGQFQNELSANPGTIKSLEGAREQTSRKA
jgi:ribonuclease BN (tRNA processing enzyme)